MPRFRFSLIGCAAALSLAALPSSADNTATAPGSLKDLYFGEALYYAKQGYYFESLQRLDTELAQHHDLDEPQLDSLYYHEKQADFDVGDFELNYRMHHRAGRAIRKVLEGDVDEAVRNDAAFRLARIHFQKGQLAEAQHALDRIQGRIPPEIRDDIEFLRANVDLAIGHPSNAALVLKTLQGSEHLAGFAAYNLGIALLQDGHPQDAIEQLTKAGTIKAEGPADLAIRDKSNLVLGTILYESADFGRAAQALDRVRLEGPFSNQALLRAGWAEASAQRFDRALVPWNTLVEREPTDAAVQEAMLAVPHAYAKLNVNGRAALMYGRALESFTHQIERVDASIDSIREGLFLKALVSEEIRQDKDWVIRLRSLPDAPETYYLMELMASHDFQTALQNYLDLDDLRFKLATWQNSFDAFEDMIALRRANYEPLLPQVDAQFRELDSQMRVRLEQRKHLGERLQRMLIAPRPEYLATADERIITQRLKAIDKALNGSTDPQSPALRERVDHLRGALTWRLLTQYHERLTQAHVHLNQLTADVDALTKAYEAYVRTRQAVTHSYVGYDVQIGRLRERVASAQERVTLVMARQGHIIENVAINRLNARRERLVAQQTEARYEVADSYDRAQMQSAEAQVH